MPLKKICIFIGPPGAGKGSLSALCVNNLDFYQLSTGNLCREHISQGTPIGQKIDFAIKSGKLVCDDLVLEMVNHWFLSNGESAHSVIFDGLPRTVFQARALHELITQRHKSDLLLNIVHLKVSEQELISRVLDRAVCQNKKCQAVYSCKPGSEMTSRRPMMCDVCNDDLIKRSDDTRMAIKQRLKCYYDREKELLEYYESINSKPYLLDVERRLNDVFAELKNVLK